MGTKAAREWAEDAKTAQDKSRPRTRSQHSSQAPSDSRARKRAVDCALSAMPRTGITRTGLSMLHIYCSFVLALI